VPTAGRCSAIGFAACTLTRVCGSVATIRKRHTLTVCAHAAHSLVGSGRERGSDLMTLISFHGACQSGLATRCALRVSAVDVPACSADAHAPNSGTARRERTGRALARGSADGARAHGRMGCGAVGRVPAAVVFSPSSVAVALALTSASDDACSQHQRRCARRSNGHTAKRLRPRRAAAVR
jgi:hypothetical protein